ncbi:MAG: 5'-methylthioadenosine phosphorylase [Alphaproteobacteria bacterium]|nr:5'-methylthioadenosine phosphorylase [Alphaproteobacteria bacterium]
MPAAVIVGSAFDAPTGTASLLGALEPEAVPTDHGPVTVYRHRESGGIVLFRHGRPHRWLPHQVPWLAHAQALAALDVHALLVTSSVGVLSPDVPLFQPMLLSDLIMRDNRLPDGRPCTMWQTPTPGQAHLVVREGLFSATLSAWLEHEADLPGQRLTFLYVPGPRTKTPAENDLAARTGAQVNSMSLAPEVVLANELGMPVAGLVTGHKYSVSGGVTPDRSGIADSLERARRATAVTIRRFLAGAPRVVFGNELFRFGPDPA